MNCCFLSRIASLIIFCTFVVAVHLPMSGCSRYEWASSQYYELEAPAATAGTLPSAISADERHSGAPDEGIIEESQPEWSEDAPGLSAQLPLESLLPFVVPDGSASSLSPHTRMDYPNDYQLSLFTVFSQPTDEREPARATLPPEPDPPCININTADEQQLTSLPGIGKKRAQDIIKARTRKPFRRKSDLQRVKGIGKKMLSRLSPRICDF